MPAGSLASGAKLLPVMAVLLACAGLAILRYRQILRLRPGSVKAALLMATPAGLAILAALAALLAWRAGLLPGRAPLLAMLLCAPIAALLAALFESPGAARGTVAIGRVLAWGGLAVGCVEATRYLIAMRPLTESVDFYYYVCVSRDLAKGATDLPEARHGYFPGVYMFWELVIRLLGESLGRLQWVYVGLLVGNAALLGALAGRAITSPAAGVYAALLYLMLSSRLEGFEGCTEPLATIPCLAGALAWGGGTLRDAAGWRSAVALGAGFGLTVLAKQQGGLLALGAAALLPALFHADRAQRHSWLQVLAIPTISTVVLVGGILGVGEGLTPLRIGLGTARDYPASGPFLENLHNAARSAWLMFSLGLAAALAWAVLAVWRRDLHSQPWFRILGFAVVAGAASLIQFTKRPYTHYSLLAAPFLVLAPMLVGAHLARSIPPAAWASPIARVLGVWLLAIPFVRGDNVPGAFFLLPPRPLGAAGIRVPWRMQPEIAKDIGALGQYLVPGEDTLVLPPRRNEIHLLRGTRSVSFELGYGWAMSDARGALGKPGLRAVVEIYKGLDPTDQETWRYAKCDAAVASLPAAGFRPVAVLPTLTVWRRE